MAGAYYSSNTSANSQPTFPIHLCFFLVILFTFLGFSWYTNYESILESLFDQIKLFLIVSPLLFLLTVHWISNSERGGRISLLNNIPILPAEKESFHRAGGTPWGVGFLLVVLLFLISYQSYFQERWFPLLSR